MPKKHASIPFRALEHETLCLFGRLDECAACIKHSRLASSMRFERRALVLLILCNQKAAKPRRFDLPRPPVVKGKKPVPPFWWKSRRSHLHELTIKLNSVKPSVKGWAIYSTRQASPPSRSLQVAGGLLSRIVLRRQSDKIKGEPPTRKERSCLKPPQEGLFATVLGLAGAALCMTGVLHWKFTAGSFPQLFSDPRKKGNPFWGLDHS